MDYEKLDQGVRRLVRKLNEAGFVTTDSGDGTLIGKEDMEGTLDVPHVHMECEPIHYRRVSYGLLLDLRRWLKPEALNKLEESHAIQYTYSPIDDTGVLSLYGICDDDLKENA